MLKKKGYSVHGLKTIKEKKNGKLTSYSSSYSPADENSAKSVGADARYVIKVVRLICANMLFLSYASYVHFT